MTGKKSKFKIPSSGVGLPSDPEALFRDLRQRSPEIQHLWSHQADILRKYHTEHLSTGDVAIELPTGAGKTLVGLLIGEFRRRTNQERVLYLCPTRQLAYQVGNQAKTHYGIASSVLVGSQAKYDEAAYAQYVQAKAVGIATYSGVFNTNPRLNDPNVLILDDAHAAENYISDLWTVDIERDEFLDVYLGLLDIVAGALSPSLVEKLRSERGDPLGILVDKVPMPYFCKRMEQVREFLDEKTAGGKLRFSWSMIRDHLLACSLFVTWQRFSLRPLIPPSLTHRPFANAGQRIYMSATLGEGGELERITGIRRIERLPVPAGWDKQSTGRRFIVFPNHSLGEDGAITFVVKAIKKVPRALVLCPRVVVAQRFKKSVKADLRSFSVLEAKDVEESLEPFTNSKSLLVLTARYDGIDLPGDACRLEVIAGLPGATNTQEQFFLSRLGAHSLLRDRIRTRISQAVGRCTRHATDYAAVILLGTDLLRDCSRREFRAGLHPELQAEFEFGLENSEVEKHEDLLGLLQEFLEHGEVWAEAEQSIQTLRESKRKVPDPVCEKLMAVAPYEVDFVYALFKGNVESAFQVARSIVDSLSGGSELKPYRAWWYYLAGALALLRAEAGEENLAPVAKDFFQRADAASISVSWFSKLAQLGLIPASDTGFDYLLGHAVEGIYDQLSKLSFLGPKFERALKEFNDNIRSDNHDRFSRGLRTLGDFLGFDGQVHDGTATPDVTWCMAETVFAFEVKVEESSNDGVSVSTCRQTAGHLDWSRAYMPGFGNVRAVLVSRRKTLQREAKPHAASINYIHAEEIRGLANRATSFLRELRTECSALSEEASKDTIAQRLALSPLHPRKVISTLEHPLLKLEEA